MKRKLIGASLLALATIGAGYLTLDLGLLPAGSATAPGSHSEDDGHKHGDVHEQEGPRDGHQNHEGEEGTVHLTDAQIAKSGIDIIEAKPGDISQEVEVTGTIVPDADRLAHVTTRIPGIVAEVPRNLGDAVGRGDVLAVLQSRELAEAKAEYLSALRKESLASTTLRREKDLWLKKVSAEQDYLDAQTAAATAQIALDAAQQRLATLGLTGAEIKNLPKQDPYAMSRLEVRSPIAGRVTNREVTRGELVSADKEIFTIVDLSSVWIEIPVYAADLQSVREGQTVTLKGANGQTAQGRIVFTGPTIDPQTGAARTVASLQNDRGIWRPGDFVSGTIATGGESADVVVPASAIQTIGGDTVVFTRTEEGFERRIVVIGRRNGRTVEIVFGLFPGDRVASGNTFLLKAEASRGAAEHSHSH